jgi:hypothetical protein
MSVDLVLSFNVRVFDGQTPDVEVIANCDNNGVLEPVNKMKGIRKEEDSPQN